MNTLPEPRRVYVGGPAISPPYLAGRRILVKRVLTWGDLCRLTGNRGIAETDDLLRRGESMPEPRDPKKPIQIEATTMIRGRRRSISISVESWDGVPA